MTAWPRGLVRRRLVLVVTGLLAACCLAMSCMQALVAADRVGDLATVAGEAGPMLVLVGVGGVAVWFAWTARARGDRIVLTTIVAATLVASASFAKTVYVDVSVALNALVHDSDGTDTVLVLGPGGDDVRLSGDLTEGAGARLAALLEAHPAVTRIHLTSDGGLADEGEALRKVIARHGLTTFVPDYCVSACTLAFLGGRERLVMTDARLGFHAPFEEGLFGQTFAGDASAERASYLAAGVARDFVDAALKVAPADLWTPHMERLVAAHVVTGLVDRYRFPSSDLDGANSLAGARESVLRNFVVMKAFARARPQVVDAISRWYLASYRAGRSEGEIADGLKSAVGGLSTVALSDADEDTLFGLARFLVTAMNAADTESTCVAIGRAASLIEAQATLDESDASADDLALALVRRALDSPGTPRQAALRPVRASGALMPAPAMAQRPCADVRDLYARVLRLPRHEGAAYIRAILSRSESEPGMPADLASLSH